MPPCPEENQEHDQPTPSHYQPGLLPKPSDDEQRYLCRRREKPLNPTGMTKASNLKFGR